MIDSKYKLARVEWDDSCGGSPKGWERVSEVVSACTSMMCVSVGYLVHEDENWLVIASHLALSDEGETETSGAMYIPKGVVRSVRFLVSRYEDVSTVWRDVAHGEEPSNAADLGEAD